MGLLRVCLEHASENERVNFGGFVWVCFCALRFVCNRLPSSSKNREFEARNRHNSLVSRSLSMMGLFGSLSPYSSESEEFSLNGFVWVCSPAPRSSSLRRGSGRTALQARLRWVAVGIQDSVSLYPCVAVRWLRDVSALRFARAHSWICFRGAAWCHCARLGT